jgi:hypothetical protein
MAKTKREHQLQREIEAKLRKNTSNQITEVTNIIQSGSGGSSSGLVDAPTDGTQYLRKDGAWVNPDYNGLDNIPLVFPPDIHTHLLVDITDYAEFTLPDGDYGDIIVSGVGAVMTIDDEVVTEAKMSLADNTTLNVSTARHGFVPKAPNDITQVLRGDGTWGTVIVAAILIKQLIMGSLSLQSVGSISGTFILNLPLP